MAITLLIILITAILVLITATFSRTLSKILALAGSIAAPIYLFLNYKIGDTFILNLKIYPMHFGLTEIGWFFGIIIFSLFILFTIGSFYEGNSGTYYFFALMSLLGAAGVLFAKDLITFFFFFETMSFFSFILVLKGKNEYAPAAAFKYIVWSVAGGYSFLLAAFLIISKTHSVMISDISYIMGWTKYLIFVLLLVPFAVKSALMPFHLWAPEAYRNSKDSFTMFLSGGLSKLGIFGYFVAFLVMFGNLSNTGHTFTFGYLFAWVGAITALFAGIYAFMQDDAKKLLAYSSISQLGYVAFGFGLSTFFSISASLFHALGHAVFESLLFLVVAGVYHRTKTTDMRKMGGLIKKMPLSFIGLLFGIIATAGIPPTIGFPSKWMLYEAAIIKGDLFLTGTIFLASITAFLYSFKLVHSIFLGKLHKEHENLKEAPLGYGFGTIVLLIPLFVFGIQPGIVLGKVYSIVKDFKMPDFSCTNSVVISKLGTFDARTIGLVMIIMFIVAFLIYLIGGKIYRSKQTDNYTAGEAIGEDFELHYSSEFYGFFRREFGGFLKLSWERILNKILDVVNILSDGLRSIYTGDGRAYLFYVILFLAIIAVFMKGRLTW